MKMITGNDIKFISSNYDNINIVVKKDNKKVLLPYHINDAIIFNINECGKYQFTIKQNKDIYTYYYTKTNNINDLSIDIDYIDNHIIFDTKNVINKLIVSGDINCIIEYDGIYKYFYKVDDIKEFNININNILYSKLLVKNPPYLIPINKGYKLNKKYEYDIDIYVDDIFYSRLNKNDYIIKYEGYGKIDLFIMNHCVYTKTKNDNILPILSITDNKAYISNLSYKNIHFNINGKDYTIPSGEYYTILDNYDYINISNIKNARFN